MGAGCVLSSRLKKWCKDLEDTKTISQQLQSTLATVVAEKEQLTIEYIEMKAVSEELMTIVEGSAASA